MKKKDEALVIIKTLAILLSVAGIIYLITLDPLIGGSFVVGFLFTWFIYTIVRNEHKRKITNRR